MAKKERIGIVVSDKSQKTIIVAIQIRYQHSKYMKVLIKTKRFMVQDEKNECNSGDLVLIQESAPFSRWKTWALKKILISYKNNK